MLRLAASAGSGVTFAELRNQYPYNRGTPNYFATRAVKRRSSSSKGAEVMAIAKRPVQSRGKRTQEGDETQLQPDRAADNQSLSMGSEPSEEDIRLRAYQKYLDRGADHGRHLEDWMEAESELRKDKS
jgi:hypothetical protein